MQFTVDMSYVGDCHGHVRLVRVPDCKFATNTWDTLSVGENYDVRVTLLRVCEIREIPTCT